MAQQCAAAKWQAVKVDIEELRATRAELQAELTHIAVQEPAMPLSASTPAGKYFTNFSRVMQSEVWRFPALQGPRRQESLTCRQPISAHRAAVLAENDVWAPGDIAMPAWVPAAAAHRAYLGNVAIVVDMGDGRQEFWKPLYLGAESYVCGNDKVAAP